MRLTLRRKCVTDHLNNAEVDKAYLKHSTKSLDPMMVVLIGTLTYVGRTLW